MKCVPPNNTSNLLLLLWPLLNATAAVAMHISGEWHNTDVVTILAKFGFQTTDAHDMESTRGFIYGNFTPAAAGTSGSVLLVLLTRHYWREFYEASKSAGQSDAACGRLLGHISRAAFDARCLYNGTRQDFFRAVPCAAGELCADEDTPSRVVPHYQMTFRVQEPYLPGFWYLALVNCHLDTSCTWRRQRYAVSLRYSAWLVNGGSGTFGRQFSFDEQDTAQIYMAACAAYLLLCALQARAVAIYSGGGYATPLRAKILLGVCSLQSAAISLRLADLLVYAADGGGAPPLRYAADCLWVLGVNALGALVVAIAAGYGIVATRLPRATGFALVAIVLAAVHLGLFVWNSFAVDDLEEIDVYETLPGYLIMAVRVVYMLWFLYHVKITVARCSRRHEEHKAEFVLHVGAAFLVWFVYMPVLGILASRVAPLWRFKIILGITFVGDWCAAAALLHLFWPRSTNRRYFVDNFLPADDAHLDDQERLVVDANTTTGLGRLLPVRRSLRSTNSDDWDDFENALISDEIIPLDPLTDGRGAVPDGDVELFAAD